MEDVEEFQRRLKEYEAKEPHLFFEGIVCQGKQIDNQQLYAVQSDEPNGLILTCFKEPKTMFSVGEVAPLDLSQLVGQKIKVSFKMREGNTLFGACLANITKK